MSLTEKIFALEAKKDALEQQLTSQISGQERLLIRQQIITKENLLSELYKQNALVGMKTSVHRIH